MPRGEPPNRRGRVGVLFGLSVSLHSPPSLFFSLPTLTPSLPVSLQPLPISPLLLLPFPLSPYNLLDLYTETHRRLQEERCRTTKDEITVTSSKCLTEKEEVPEGAENPTSRRVQERMKGFLIRGKFYRSDPRPRMLAMQNERCRKRQSVPSLERETWDETS